MAVSPQPDAAARSPVLGIDIGGSGLKIGLVDISGDPKLLAFDRLKGHPTDDPERVMDAVAAAADRLFTRVNVPRAALRLAGVGCAGLIDLASGSLVTSPNLPAWRDVPLRDGMARRLGVPVTVLNDAEAFLTAEWKAGSARGARHAVFVAIGTGVGGGLVLNGAPFRGATGLAGEVGHMSIHLDGGPCPCGNRGCLEMFLGRTAIKELALAADLPPGDAASPARMAALAGSGDERAIRVYDTIGTRLGTAMAGLANLLEPEVIVIGGGVAAAGRFLLEPAERALHLRSMVARRHALPLKGAHFGPQAGMVGAALRAMESAS